MEAAGVIPTGKGRFRWAFEGDYLNAPARAFNRNILSCAGEA
jgi:hypothetical protein